MTIYPTPSAMDNKQRILHAAQKEFSSKGFEGASVDTIAQKVKVAKSLIYYYFNSKEDLLQAITANFFEELLQ